MKAPYINHVTTTTSHCRRSYRDEVGDEILARLRPWIDDVLASTEPLPIPIKELSNFRMNAAVEQGALVCTVWMEIDSEQKPIATIGISRKSRHGPDLWAMMIGQFPAHSGIKRPESPWCAVALHGSILNDLEKCTWIADFERCVAWAWLTKVQKPEAVDN